MGQTPCPNCGENLKYQQKYVGKKVRCPKCDQPFRIPGESMQPKRIPSPQLPWLLVGLIALVSLLNPIGKAHFGSVCIYAVNGSGAPVTVLYNGRFLTKLDPDVATESPLRTWRAGGTITVVKEGETVEAYPNVAAGLHVLNIGTGYSIHVRREYYRSNPVPRSPNPADKEKHTSAGLFQVAKTTDDGVFGFFESPPSALVDFDKKGYLTAYSLQLTSNESKRRPIKGDENNWICCACVPFGCLWFLGLALSQVERAGIGIGQLLVSAVVAGIWLAVAWWGCEWLAHGIYCLP